MANRRFWYPGFHLPGQAILGNSGFLSHSHMDHCQLGILSCRSPLFPSSDVSMAGAQKPLCLCCLALIVRFNCPHQLTWNRSSPGPFKRKTVQTRTSPNVEHRSMSIGGQRTVRRLRLAAPGLRLCRQRHQPAESGYRGRSLRNVHGFLKAEHPKDLQSPCHVLLCLQMMARPFPCSGRLLLLLARESISTVRRMARGPVSMRCLACCGAGWWLASTPSLRHLRGSAAVAGPPENGPRLSLFGFRLTTKKGHLGLPQKIATPVFVAFLRVLF